MPGDVIVYSFECLAERAEQVFRQSPEEKAPHQVDVAGGGFDHRLPAVRGQFDLGRPPVLCGQVALDQVATFHSSSVMRQPAPLPADLGRQGADLHALGLVLRRGR